MTPWTPSGLLGSRPACDYVAATPRQRASPRSTGARLLSPEAPEEGFWTEGELPGVVRAQRTCPPRPLILPRSLAGANEVTAMTPAETSHSEPSSSRPPRRPLMTREQAGTHLGVAPTFMTRCRGHKIPHRRIGRNLRYLPEELEEWVPVGEEDYEGAPCRTCEAREAGPRRRRPGPSSGDAPTSA